MTPPYVCPYCGRVLSDATALLSHMKRFERGEKCILGFHGSPETHPFPCSECELRFTSKRGLSVHLTKTHKIERPKFIRDPLLYPFNCVLCGVRVKTETGLKIHQTTIHDIRQPKIKKKKIPKPIPIPKPKPIPMSPQIYQKYDIFMDLKNEIKQDEQHTQSCKEILLRCNGDLGKLTDEQIMILKTGGIIMPNQLSLTTKGLTMFLGVLKSKKQQQLKKSERDIK